LVASRSDGDGFDGPDDVSSEEPKSKGLTIRSGRPDGEEGAEFTVHVKLGYKAILLVVVFFDLIHLSVREIINRDLFGLIPD
jgi:hypothetical protein